MSHSSQADNRPESQRLPLHLNNLGSVVYTSSSSTNSYFWKNGAASNITLATVNGLNDSDYVAGVVGTENQASSYSYDANTYGRVPVLWTPDGTMTTNLYNSVFIGYATGGYDDTATVDDASVAGIDNSTNIYANYDQYWLEGDFGEDPELNVTEIYSGAGKDTIAGTVAWLGASYTTNSILYPAFNLRTVGSGGGVLGDVPHSGGGYYRIGAYWDGASIQSTPSRPVVSDVLTSVNSLGQILGVTWTNSAFAPITYNMGTNTITSPPFAGMWNASHQIIGSANPSYLIGVYESLGTPVQMTCDHFYDPSTNNGVTNSLSNLVPTNSGWSGISGTAINDAGAIVGTATYSGTNNTPGSHGVMLLPDYITRDGNMVNSTNNTVWVGQQINLTNMVLGSATNAAVTSYHWAIPGANNTTNDTAFYDYKPNATSSNYTNLFTPTNYTTNSYCNFYWSSGGSNQIVYCTNVVYGQTNVVSATFNVSRPTDTITTPQIGTIFVGTNDSSDYGQPFLYFGDTATNAIPGITFTNAAPSASSIGTNLWVQLITSDVVTLSPPTTNFPSRAGLDTGHFPYSSGLEADDSPDEPLSSIRTNAYRNFNATMYLMWQPDSSNPIINGDRTVPVPLKAYPWHWSATAINTNGTWTGPVNPQYPPTNAANVDATNEPSWSTNSGWNYPAYP